MLRPAGFELNRFRYESDSVPITESMRTAALLRVVKTLNEAPPVFLNIDWSASKIERCAREFFEAFRRCPIKQGIGGCGFNAGLLLFISARIAQPRLIVESGTFQGYTSWVFQTACPDADIHCFDISFVNRLWHHPKIRYHQHDWAEKALPFSVPANSLGFFDDHISQAQRVIEATERGFTRLIFDDNLPLHALHRDGLPAVPTIDMVFDESLKEGDEFDWVSAGRNFRYQHSAAVVGRARSAIERVIHGPELLNETGYPSANLTFVECHRGASDV
jgi:hypothetical protein